MPERSWWPAGSRPARAEPGRAPIFGLRGAVGAALALSGALIFYLLVIAVDPAVTVGRAAAPWPDGAEYLDAAVSLVRDGTYRIHVGGELHPPRYPFGYSLLIAAALTFGVEPEFAPHIVNQLAGLALLALVAVPLWRRRLFLESGLAVLLLATLPAFIVLSRAPLSEVSGTVPVVGAVFLLFHYARTGNRVLGGLGAAILTASTSIRTIHLLLGTFIPAAVIARHGRDLRMALRDLPALAAPAAAGLAPVLVYHFVAFDGIAQTGYGYWIAGFDRLPVFHVDNLARSLPDLWRELIEHETSFTTANLYARGSYLGPALALLALLAPLGLARDRRLWCFATAAILSGAALQTNYWAETRFLFPLLVLAIPLVASGTVGLWRRPRKGVAIVATMLAVAAAIGWPAAGGRRSMTLDLLWPAKPPSPSSAFVVGSQFKRLSTASEKLVLTELPPPYVHAILPAGSLVAPLYDDHDFSLNPRVFFFAGAERRRLVAAALQEGREVWALVYRRDILVISKDSPAPEGQVWEIVARKGKKGGIARLVAVPPQETSVSWPTAHLEDRPRRDGQGNPTRLRIRRPR